MQHLSILFIISIIVSIVLFTLFGCPVSSSPQKDICQIGAMLGDVVQQAWFPAYGEQGIQNFEDIIEKKLACIKLYKRIIDEFPLLECIAIYNHGTEQSPTCPYLDIHPSDPVNYPDEGILENIINREYDDDIYKWASDIKEYGAPIWLCFDGEMNGDWHCGSGFANGGDTVGPERYIDAWKHIHDIFTIEEADNVAWVWTVNHEDWPNEEWNKFENYYPGDNYVDWLGIDGYNWNRGEYGGWESFSILFDTALDRLREINDQKPIILSEFACAHEPAKKSEWIRDAFNEIKNRDYIKCFIWFNEDKEENWLIDSDGKETPREVLSNPCFYSKGDPGTLAIFKPGNIALNKNAVASSEESPEYKAVFAVDGKGSINVEEIRTRWASENTNDEWIYIDLEQEYTITRVVLDWEQAHAISYEIQVTNSNPDNENNWTVIKSIEDGDGGIDDITSLDNHSPSRYIKMLGVAPVNEEWGYSLWEFIVCGE